MAWCPFAIHKPLSENHTQGGITPRAIILHTAVSSSPSLFSFFQNNSTLESHFYVRDDGTIEQYMDTRIRADANKNANAFAVSIESQDGGQIRPWTQAQVDSIVRLCDWLCTTHGIPRVRIPTWNGSGIGWHVMFGAPGPWTPVSKLCPGWPRIEQAKNVIIPRVAARQIGDDGMEQSEKILNPATGQPALDLNGNPYTVGQVLYYDNINGWATRSAVDGLKGEVSALSRKVDALAVAGVDVVQLAELLKPAITTAIADELSRRLAS